MAAGGPKMSCTWTRGSSLWPVTWRTVCTPVWLSLPPWGFSGHAFRWRTAELLKGLWFGLGKAVPLCTLLPLCLQSKRKINGYLSVYCQVLWGWQEKYCFRERVIKAAFKVCWPSFMGQAVHNISEKKDATARLILRHLFLQLGNQIITWNECPHVSAWMQHRSSKWW